MSKITRIRKSTWKEGSEAAFPVWEEVVWFDGKLVKVIETVLCQIGIQPRAPRSSEDGFGLTVK